MLISILGDVIDTEDIYEVTKIKYRIDPYASNLMILLNHKKEECEIVDYFWFKVMFFNNKELYIELSSGKMSWYSPRWYEEDYNTKLEDMKKQINDLRDKIIEYWQKNKSEIPHLEFGKI